MKRIIFALLAVSAAVRAQNVLLPGYATQSSYGTITGSGTGTDCSIASSCTWIVVPSGYVSVESMSSGAFNGTLQFEYSIDGSHWASLPDITGTTNITSAPQTNYFNLSGGKFFRVRASQFVSGPVFVNLVGFTYGFAQLKGCTGAAGLASVSVSTPSGLTVSPGTISTSGGTFSINWATGQTPNQIVGSDGAGNVGLMSLGYLQLPTAGFTGIPNYSSGTPIASTFSTVANLWGCTGFMKADGTCATSVGMGDPGSNGLMKRTSLNTTGIAASADVVGMWGGGACSGYLKNDGTCSTSTTANIQGINAQVAGYTLVGADNARFVPLTFTASGNLTLPTPGSGAFTNGFWAFVMNKGSFNIQLQPAGGKLIDGRTFGLLNPGKGMVIQTDGTNWFSIGGSRGVIDVTDFGCRGDTLHDDATCINNAVLAAAAIPGNGIGQGGIVYFPAGAYSIASPILMPRTGDVPTGGVTLVGENKNSTYINALTASWPTVANDIFVSNVGYGYITNPTCTVTGTGWTVGCTAVQDVGTVGKVYFNNPPPTGYGTGVPTITIGAPTGAGIKVTATATAIRPFMVEWDNTHNGFATYASSASALTVTHTLNNVQHKFMCVNADGTSNTSFSDVQGNTSDSITFSPITAQAGACYITNGRGIHEGIRNLAFIEPQLAGTGGIKYRGYAPQVGANPITERAQDLELIDLRMEGDNRWNPIDILAGGDQNSGKIANIISDPNASGTDALNVFDTTAVYLDACIFGTYSNEACGMQYGDIHDVYGGFRRAGRSSAVWGRAYISTIKTLNCDGLRGVNPNSYCMGFINGGKNIIHEMINEGLSELAQVHLENETGDTLVQPNLGSPNSLNGHPIGNGIEVVHGSTNNKVLGIQMNHGNGSWASGGTFMIAADSSSPGNWFERIEGPGTATDFSVAAAPNTYIQWCSVNSGNGPDCFAGTWSIIGTDPYLFDTSAHSATVPLDASAGFAFKDTSGNNLIGENGAANTITIGTASQTVNIPGIMTGKVNPAATEDFGGGSSGGTQSLNAGTNSIRLWMFQPAFPVTATHFKFDVSTADAANSYDAGIYTCTPSGTTGTLVAHTGSAIIFPTTGYVNPAATGGAFTLSEGATYCFAYASAAAAPLAVTFTGVNKMFSTLVNLSATTTATAGVLPASITYTPGAMTVSANQIYFGVN